MNAELPLADKFDVSESEDTDPRLTNPLSPPISVVEAELKLLRAGFQAQGKALGALQQTTVRLEEALAQHGENSHRAMDRMNQRLDETHKLLDEIFQALKLRAGR